MAVFQIDIQKRLGPEFFTNRYFANGTNLVEAVTVSEAFVDAERAIHGSAVEFVNARVSTVATGDELFDTRPLGGTGIRNVPSYLPLWNVIRVDFGVSGRRPHYKLYRGVLSEDDIVSDFISPTLVDFVNLQLQNILGLNATGTGVLLGDAVCNPRVKMRQLRRGTKRRNTPIIPGT